MNAEWNKTRLLGRLFLFCIGDQPSQRGLFDGFNLGAAAAPAGSHSVLRRSERRYVSVLGSASG